MIENDPRDAVLVSHMLRRGWSGGLVMSQVERVLDAAEALREGATSCVLVGLRAGESVSDILHQLRAGGPHPPIVVLSEADDETEALVALRAGAADYLPKPLLNPAQLGRAVRHAIERKRSEARLTHQALHDDLTGLPNRALFLDRLSVALDRLRRTRGRIGVLFLDVDNFKDINDGLGHAAGDRVLIVLADRLRKLLRPTDTVARFGGDEFTFLISDLEAEDEVELVAERITRVSTLPIVLDEGEWTVTVSIGLATAGDPDLTPEAVIREADASMYRVKKHHQLHRTVVPRRTLASASGGGSAAPGITLRPAETGPARPAGAEGEDPQSAPDEPHPPHLTLAAPCREDPAGADLRAALERAELRIHYQPKVSLHRGAGVLGLEALLRWEHPERGVIAPSEFIELAERSGLIIPLGRYVIEHALHELKTWQRSQPEITLSINVSATQLADRELAALLVRGMAAAGIAPDALCLEISESALAQDPAGAAHAIDEIKQLGVLVAIDDFGTGASSLLDLQRLPVDALKLDGTLVAAADASRAQSALVGAVVELGHALGLRVVAEGVETEEQMAEMQQLGCDEAQGFFFSHPVPAEQVEAMLALA